MKNAPRHCSQAPDLGQIAVGGGNLFETMIRQLKSGISILLAYKVPMEPERAGSPPKEFPIEMRGSLFCFRSSL